MPSSTRRGVCHPKHAPAPQGFEASACGGKTTVGGFYGFKLHGVLDDEGELWAFKLTAGHLDDRVLVAELSRGLFGKPLGGQGYSSQKLFDELYERGVELITRGRKKMKHKLMRLLLGKRASSRLCTTRSRTSRR